MLDGGVISRERMQAHMGQAITELPAEAVWRGFWPVIDPDSLVVEDVIDHNDDFSDCVFVDRAGDDVRHHAGAGECAVRRGAIRVFVCADKATVAGYLGLPPEGAHTGGLCADFIHFMMSAVERAGLAPLPDARAEHWAGEMYRDGMGVSFGVMAVRAPFEALVRPLAEEALRRGRGAV